jgi:integrase-like protein
VGRALAFYRSHGIEAERLMTDNGSASISVAHAPACKDLRLRHIRTRPRPAQTNGKVERFTRTTLREWAYATVYGSSPEKAAALSGWVERYNFRRRHGTLGHRPPIARLQELNGSKWLASTARDGRQLPRVIKLPVYRCIGVSLPREVSKSQGWRIYSGTGGNLPSRQMRSGEQSFVS